MGPKSMSKSENHKQRNRRQGDIDWRFSIPRLSSQLFKRRSCFSYVFWIFGVILSIVLAIAFYSPSMLDDFIDLGRIYDLFIIPYLPEIGVFEDSTKLKEIMISMGVQTRVEWYH